MEQERTAASRVFLNMVSVFVPLAGSGLVPDPLQRAEMDFEVQKFATRCLSVCSESSNMALVEGARMFAHLLLALCTINCNKHFSGNIVCL